MIADGPVSPIHSVEQLLKLGGAGLRAVVSSHHPLVPGAAAAARARHEGPAAARPGTVTGDGGAHRQHRRLRVHALTAVLRLLPRHGAVRARRRRPQVTEPRGHPQPQPQVRRAELLHVPRRLRPLRRRHHQADRPEAPLPLRHRVRGDGPGRRGRAHNQALQAAGPREGEGDAGRLQRSDERGVWPVPLHLRRHLGREARGLRRRRPLERPDLHRLPTTRSIPRRSRAGPGRRRRRRRSETRTGEEARVHLRRRHARSPGADGLLDRLAEPAPPRRRHERRTGPGDNLARALPARHRARISRVGSGSLDAAAEARDESAGEPKRTTP